MIHRFWSVSSPTAPPLGQWGRGVIESTQGDTPVDWSEDMLPEDVQALLKRARRQVRVEDVFRHQSNIARYWLLHEYGGLYLDQDVIPLRSLWAGPPMVAAHNDGSLCTCVLRFPAGHPLLATALRHVALLPYSGSARSEVASGEALLGRMVLASYPEIEHNVLPFDPTGRRTPDTELWAIHLNNNRRS